jgi:hypothetical protein
MLSALALGGTAAGQLVPADLQPPPDGNAVRAMWYYPSASSFDNLNASQAVIDFCAREGVNRIYCGAYGTWTGANATRKNNLRAFLAAARASGIRVEALLDGTDWQDNPAIVRTRIDQILALHNVTPADPNDDFAAIHFDIEFWLDDTWVAPESTKREVAIRYFDNVLVNARNHLATRGAAHLPIGVDLSSHFDTAGLLPTAFAYGGQTQHFLGHVLDLVDDVVLMSYYDTATALANVSNFELDLAAGKGRRIQLGADLQPTPPEVPTNTFADNLPTAFSAMTSTLELFQSQLSATRRAALDGFSVFHYGGYRGAAPAVRNIADNDGDGDADLVDFSALFAYWAGPGLPAAGLAADADLDRDGDVDLADAALLQLCFTGTDVTGPIPAACER